MCNKRIGVYVKSENVPMTQKLGQLGANNKILDKTILSMSSPAFKASIKFTEIIRNILEILAVFKT